MVVLTVIGNRPQFVKSAPLSVALRDRGIREVVVHTGQHYDHELSDVFVHELRLGEPEHRLDLRTAEVSVMEQALARLVESHVPGLVVVFGDTNSTLAGMRAGTSQGVEVAHVEAGLRSGDMSMPEERNRIEVDHAAGLLFAPDQRSRDQLLAEGVGGRIEVVGDVMADATRIFRQVALERCETPFAPHSYVLATIHREANVGEGRLRRILAGLGRVEASVVLPAHPRTREAIRSFGIPVGDNVQLLEPMGYLPFTAALAGARVVVTDSGGVQKEAYWLGVPCVTTRPSTEWVDTVLAGANVLVDDDPDLLVAAVQEAAMPLDRPALYGDGHASDRIAEILLERLPLSAAPSTR